jgi:hypothetical protein
MAHDAFISYQQRDKAVADAICHRMEAANIRCWIASRDVRGGENWDDAIVSAIKEAKLVVVVFSAAANASRHVLNEVTIALDSGDVVIPFRIEDIRPSGGMSLQLARVNWLDALTPPLEAHIDRLVESARLNLLPREVKLTPGRPGLTSATTQRTSRVNSHRTFTSHVVYYLARLFFVFGVALGAYLLARGLYILATAISSVGISEYLGFISLSLAVFVNLWIIKRYVNHSSALTGFDATDFLDNRLGWGTWLSFVAVYGAVYVASEYGFVHYSFWYRNGPLDFLSFWDGFLFVATLPTGWMALFALTFWHYVFHDS